MSEVGIKIWRLIKWPLSRGIGGDTVSEVKIKVTIEVKRLDQDLELPDYANPGDAGMDLRSTVDVVLPPGARELVPTGLEMAIPQGYAGYVLPRSGLARRHGVTCLNTPGLIDSGYRGEVAVILLNTDSSEKFVVRRGDRIAQIVFMPVPSVGLSVVQGLSETARGNGGFGSTGV